MNLQELKSKVIEAEGQRKLLNTQKIEAEKVRDEFNTKLGTIDQAIALLQLTAKETQEQLKFHIEDLVQSALDTCFPDKYTFRVVFELKRGRTEARLLLDNEGEDSDPMNDNGGGVVDIISFALRIAAWCLSKKDNILVFDEPYKFLSVNLRPLACHILRKLSKRLGIQIIVVTHDEAMIDIAHKIFEIDQDKKGVSFIV